MKDNGSFFFGIPVTLPVGLGSEKELSKDLQIGSKNGLWQ